MSVLLWWLIPVAATFLALGWVAVRNRPSKPVDAEQGMADLERFRQAMAKPLPAGGVRRDAAAGVGPDADVLFDQDLDGPEAPPTPQRRSA